MKDNRTTTKFEFAGQQFEVKHDHNHGSYETRNRVSVKAFVFGVNLDDTILDEVAKAVGAKDKYTRRGEYPEVDAAYDHYNAMIVAVERTRLVSALNALGIDVTKCDIKFSRYAGCSCGCSPGFTIKGEAVKQLSGDELFIDPVKEKPLQLAELPTEPDVTIEFQQAE